jgi:hypothetical protein
MKFWKEHLLLRIVLMILFFVAGLVLVFVGWSMTGEITGLYLMLLGIILMLTTLFLYNKAY